MPCDVISECMPKKMRMDRCAYAGPGTYAPHQVPQSLGGHGVLALVNRRAVHPWIAPALRGKHVIVGVYVATDVSHDGLKLGHHRNPSFAPARVPR